MNNTIKFSLMFILVLALLAAAGGAGWWLSARHAQNLQTEPMPAPAATHSADKPLYWYDPMYPQQHFDQPGKSPFMDMDLVPKYAGNDAAASGVSIDPIVRQNLGVKLAQVESIALADRIEVTGVLGFDQRDVAIVQTRSAGFVERVWPLAPGDLVQKNQPIAELLVSEWAAASYELLAVQTSGDPRLLAAARERLRLLGMPEAAIKELEQTQTVRSHYTLSAPIAGMVQNLDVRTGMSLQAGQTLARINGLASVWLDVAVPEAQASQIDQHSTVLVKPAGFDAEPLSAKVSSILPALNSTTRSLQVRIELPNPKAELRPGNTAQVTLFTHTGGQGLAVPTSAIIRTGKRALVMLKADNDGFSPLEVTLGQELGDRTVIRSGLKPGQQVVASGQFLLDSEANLSGIELSDQSRSELELHYAEAYIRGLSDTSITLEHGPFLSLNMPGMSMSFPLASPAVSQGFQVGDRVKVGVQQTPQGLLVEQVQSLETTP